MKGAIKLTIDLGKGASIVEVGAKGVGLLRELAKNSQVQLARPPLPASSAATSNSALAGAGSEIRAIGAESRLQDGLGVLKATASNVDVAVAVDVRAASGRGQRQSADNGQDVLERHCLDGGEAEQPRLLVWLSEFCLVVPIMSIYIFFSSPCLPTCSAGHAMPSSVSALAVSSPRYPYKRMTRA